MENAVEQAEQAAGYDRDRHRPQAVIVPRQVVGDEQADGDGGDRDHALDGQIDAPHQDDEGCAHGQHQRDSRRIQQSQ